MTKQERIREAEDREAIYQLKTKEQETKCEK